MQKAKILILEDDKKLAQLMQDYLIRHGFEITLEHYGDKGLYRITKEQPDIVILDILLPKMDGLTVCKEARQYYDGLILMLTANDTDDTQIKGLENGADDFVRKPIDPQVLVARINALLRRKTGEIKPLAIQIGKLRIDPNDRSAYWEDQYIDLSQKEFELLYFLADHAGKVVNRDSIMQALKGFDYDGINRTIDMTISNLRKKFNDDGREAKRIKTVWGKGYLFVKEAWSE
ncbi:MAG: DNA-binding transcriptional regulator RstA [Gammaproteobacteria bacterium]|jgi:DNA-binding response OmpR family regulator|nr:DNA-binding transcriptional regulator RstA [Gammaproteobacteria bacterium]